MLYIRMLLSMVVSLYTSRVVLNTLGVQDYGIYGVVGGVVGVAPAKRILAQLAKHQSPRQQQPSKEPTQIAFPAVIVRHGKRFFLHKIGEPTGQRAPHG